MVKGTRTKKKKTSPKIPKITHRFLVSSRQAEYWVGCMRRLTTYETNYNPKGNDGRRTCNDGEHDFRVKVGFHKFVCGSFSTASTISSESEIPSRETHRGSLFVDMK